MQRHIIILLCCSKSSFLLVLGVAHTEDLRLIQHAELGDRVLPPPRLSRQRTRREKL